MDNEIKDTQDNAQGAAQETALTETSQYNTSLTDAKQNNTLFKLAKMYSNSAMVPETYQHNTDNCFVALEMANRMGMSPMVVMQNLYIVKGKPSWAGQFCVAAINGCGKFTPLEYVFVDENGGGCYAQATRICDGKTCRSDTITMQMAKDEGWLDKNGSKWKTMPKQMMMYRSASFFARVFCPEVLMGLQTVEEIKDVNGYEEAEKTTTTITLDGAIAADYTEVED